MPRVRGDAMKGANPGQAKKANQNTRSYRGSLAKLPQGCEQPGSKKKAG